MPAKKLQPRALIAPLKVILAAFVVGQFLFAAIVLYLNLSGDGFGSSTAEQAEMYAWILFGLGMAFIFASRLVVQLEPRPEMVASLDAAEPVARAVGALFVQTIARGALAEAFGLLGTVFYLLTGRPYFLAATLISVAILFRLMPSETAVRALLGGGARRAGPGTPIEP